ncbi:ATP-binding region ATPase domain protein [Methanolacinia petrolearia DSM 11571]|uniref:ATP-binding region ATPase domain protein n=1 Tax=Methanolacinia petrolearia (strain DSM 11571 / OCM 486 / SEBR 4847) TaxID=679926 RepID=E1RK99_METP4|nr:ATP-binding protein [Methanolacinia petrolearia]ADN36912.1 ATP-binding region ATPase domain protein [Methanolacinia petrolearia DSM 11571]
MNNKIQADFDLVNPDPSALVESLRSFGYSLEASLADIIDNSIVADADDIQIQFTWLGEKSKISIIDNGCGMTEAELINSMKPGSKNPLDERDPKDLGRFGLGLKTASFSQCRRVTVGSKAEGNNIVIRRWDLDYINQCKEWRLQRIDPKEDNIFSALDSMGHGTIVLWEQMDRLVKGADKDDRKRENLFYKHIDKVKSHLSMVFHRFLEKQNSVKIQINNHPISPWDPFLKNHTATQHLPVEPIYFRGEKITVRAYVLPHRSKMDDQTYEQAGGPGGWNARQGFYIYRNNRLIVAGDWLGLGFRKETYTKLARILVDIPNSMDEYWKIDVKKSVARPPPQLREDFQRIARLTIDPATAVYRHRGRMVERQTAGDFVFPWNTNVRDGNYFYTINRKHPLIASVLNDPIQNKKKIEAMLRLIEETVPVPAIILNNMNNPDQILRPFENSPSEELLVVLEEIWNSLRDSGIDYNEAKRRIISMEPFCDYPQNVSVYLESKENER